MLKFLQFATYFKFEDKYTTVVKHLLKSYHLKSYSKYRVQSL